MRECRGWGDGKGGSERQKAAPPGVVKLPSVSSLPLQMTCTEQRRAAVAPVTPATPCFALSLLPQTLPCAWWAGAAAARAGSRSATRACGARCATTTGTSGTPASCVACCAAAPRSPPRGAAASARARGPSCWTTCAARAPRTRWAAAATRAGRATTVATGRTRAWSAQVPQRVGDRGCPRGSVPLPPPAFLRPRPGCWDSKGACEGTVLCGHPSSP